MEYKIKSFLNIFANKLTGSMEISGQQSVSLVMNKPSCQSSHSFWNLYMTAAINFIKENLEQQNSNSSDYLNDIDSDNNILSFQHGINIISANEPLINFNLTPEFSSPMDEVNKPNSQINSQQSLQFKDFNDINCEFAEIYSQEYHEAEHDYHTIAATDGKKILINQHQHYAYRGDILSFICLYEYSGLFVIVPIPKVKSK